MAKTKLRLKNYDYSSKGIYFITFCTEHREQILSEIVRETLTVGRDNLIPPAVRLLPAGVIVDRLIGDIPNHYCGVRVHEYVIMPNHVHMLLELPGRLSVGPDDPIGSPHPGGKGGMGSCRPTRSCRPTERSVPSVPMIIRALKRLSAREYGAAIWQSSFHDHIIRDEHDYRLRYDYICGNPLRWEQDEYFS